MNNTENNRDRDEDKDVHSEKVRKLLGEMPRSLTVWGTVVIAVVAIGLAAALCLLPYPYSGGESILEHIFTNQTNQKI